MNSQGRDLLKLSPLALAAFEPTIATAQAAARKPAEAPMFFNVRSLSGHGAGRNPWAGMEPNILGS